MENESGGGADSGRRWPSGREMVLDGGMGLGGKANSGEEVILEGAVDSRGKANLGGERWIREGGLIHEGNGIREG